MEQVIVKKRFGQYVFYSDRFELVSRKGKVNFTVYYEDIKEISYNIKFTIGDLLSMFLDYFSFYLSHNAFVVTSKKKIPRAPEGNTLTLNISRDDFERVKEIVPIPIEIV